MKPVPRWVLDTNVAVAAFLWAGTPSKVLNAAGERQVELWSSPILLAEIGSTLNKAKLAKFVLATGMTPSQLTSNYLQLVNSVVAQLLSQPICRDPDDDHVLACALSAKADLIVSGDKDLLVLQSFEGIPIVTAAQAMQRLAA